MVFVAVDILESTNRNAPTAYTGNQVVEQWQQ